MTKQPDEPTIARICKGCEYWERCQPSKPNKYAYRKVDCNYYQAFQYSEKKEQEDNLEGKVIDYNKDTMWKTLVKLWSKK
jgi:hypothetical protein